MQSYEVLSSRENNRTVRQRFAFIYIWTVRGLEYQPGYQLSCLKIVVIFRRLSRHVARKLSEISLQRLIPNY
jgi:hypothetical protein